MAEVTTDVTDIQDELEEDFKKDLEEKKKKHTPKCMFLCGFTEDGVPFFQIDGDMNFVNLEGLYKYAGRRINNIVDSAMGSGDAITLHIARSLDSLVEISDTITASKEENALLIADAQGNVKGVKRVQ